MSSFRDATDREDKQESYYAKWAFPIFVEIQLEQNEHDNVEVVVLSYVVREMQRVALTYMGVAFAAGSVVTVLSIMCWHLNSVFLAIAGMIQIIAGFPFAFVLYRYVLQVTFFDTLNALVIFLILGIGADDVFVFVDAWVQSAHFVPRRNDNVQMWLVERMDFTYRRAAKTMIVTTATTFFAFMATATSPSFVHDLHAIIYTAVNHIYNPRHSHANHSLWFVGGLCGITQLLHGYHRIPRCRILLVSEHTP
eukprot:650939_1